MRIIFSRVMWFAMPTSHIDQRLVVAARGMSAFSSRDWAPHVARCRQMIWSIELSSVTDVRFSGVKVVGVFVVESRRHRWNQATPADDDDLSRHQVPSAQDLHQPPILRPSAVGIDEAENSVRITFLIFQLDNFNEDIYTCDKLNHSCFSCLIDVRTLGSGNFGKIIKDRLQKIYLNKYSDSIVHVNNTIIR